MTGGRGAPVATGSPVAGRFALFADCMVAGVLATVAALGVVTAYPGFVAACATVRARAADTGPGAAAAYLLAFRQVMRSGWAVLTVPVLVAAVLALDLLAAWAGVPGARPVLAVLAVVVAAATVLGMRAAASWRPGRGWRAVAADAARHARGDVGGSALLLMAAGCAVAVVTAVPIAVIFLLGPLAVAAVAVDTRSR